MGDVRRVDGTPFDQFLLTGNHGDRPYYSLTNHWSGHVHRQVFKAFGPPNPDPERYCCVDHVNTNPLDNSLKNLRWSNRHLNALNTENERGWTLCTQVRGRPYRAQIKWMGQKTNLGRFATKEEAHKTYMEVKGFLQREYRLNRYDDKCLVWVWRLKHHIKRMEVDSEEQLRTRTLTSMGSIDKAFERYIARLTDVAIKQRSAERAEPVDRHQRRSSFA